MIFAATSTPLTGTASATGQAGPFRPELARSIWLTLSGNWVGTVRLLRSVDGGTTRLPATFMSDSLQWSANVNEAVTEESEDAARYYLDIALSSGSVTYRFAQ